MSIGTVQQALAPILGQPLRSIGRAANMVWLHFGELREIPTRDGGTKMVGDWLFMCIALGVSLSLDTL